MVVTEVVQYEPTGAQPYEPTSILCISGPYSGWTQDSMTDLGFHVLLDFEYHNTTNIILSHKTPYIKPSRPSRVTLHNSYVITMKGALTIAPMGVAGSFEATSPLPCSRASGCCCRCMARGEAGVGFRGPKTMAPSR